ncbi:MAG: ion transporter [Cytophagales bacterium]
MNKRNVSKFYNKYNVIFDQFIHFVVVLNVIVLCLATFHELKHYSRYFIIFEYFATTVFVIEYIFRSIHAYFRGNIKTYTFSILGIIDLLAILPYFVPIQILKHTNFIKMIRLFRLLTMFKMYRYSDHVKTILDVIYHKRADLIATFIAIFFVIVLSSYAMFVLEHEMQPHKLTNIFDAIWWGIGTIATVGYGDIIPVTAGGKIIASFLTLLGMGLVAIPSAILSAGFIELQNNKKKHNK